MEITVKKCATLTAVGATLGMLPAAIFFLLVALGAIKPMSNTLWIIILVIQALACCLWSINLRGIKNMRAAEGKDSFGESLCAITVSVAGLMMVLNAILNRSIFASFLGSGSGDPLATSIILMVIIIYLPSINILMWVGCQLMNKHFESLTMTKIAYAVLSFLPMFMAIILALSANNNSGAGTMKTIMIINSLITFICTVVALVGWWNLRAEIIASSEETAADSAEDNTEA